MSFPSEYPDLRLRLELDNQKRRPYVDRMPIGITVHYSAGVRLSSIMKALSDRSLGYHLVIERDGSVVQLSRLNRTVAHAGKSSWNGHSPNQNHLAVCLISWGWVTSTENEDFKSWAGTLIRSDRVRKAKDITGSMKWWHSASREQFQKLKDVCHWAIENGIDVSNICGHDEAAIPKGRKLDPGGVLPCSMSEFRKLLANETKTLPKP